MPKKGKRGKRKKKRKGKDNPPPIITEDFVNEMSKKFYTIQIVVS